MAFERNWRNSCELLLPRWMKWATLSYALPGRCDYMTPATGSNLLVSFRGERNRLLALPLTAGVRWVLPPPAFS